MTNLRNMFDIFIIYPKNILNITSIHLRYITRIYSQNNLHKLLATTFWLLLQLMGLSSLFMDEMHLKIIHMEG